MHDITSLGTFTLTLAKYDLVVLNVFRNLSLFTLRKIIENFRENCFEVSKVLSVNYKYAQPNSGVNIGA